MFDSKLFRRVNRLKQKDAADYFGISPSFLSQIEKGDRPIPDKIISKIQQDGRYLLTEDMFPTPLSGQITITNVNTKGHVSTGSGGQSVGNGPQNDSKLREENERLSAENRELRQKVMELSEKIQQLQGEIIDFLRAKG